MKPWWVSVISTGPIWRTMRVDSRSTTSTTRASLSHRAAHDAANADGSTSASSIAQPSAFDTIFDVTTTTSPSSSGLARALTRHRRSSAARSLPASISGRPATPKICRSPPISRRATARNSTIASFTGPGFVRLAACAPPTLTTGPAPAQSRRQRFGAIHRDRRVLGAVDTTAGQVISPSRSVTSSRVVSVTYGCAKSSFGRACHLAIQTG